MVADHSSHFECSIKYLVRSVVANSFDCLEKILIKDRRDLNLITGDNTVQDLLQVT